MTDLFDAAGVPDTAPHPLADRMRPAELGDVVGQEHLLGPGAPLTRMLSERRLSSIILWGPPGVGKTTIARLLAQEINLRFVQISAIFSGVADLRKVFEEAGNRRKEAGQGTLLFVDEIHRFNRAQQDSFLPHMEDGTIILVGATTENPSFELNSALNSRATTLVLNRLSDEALGVLLERAEAMLGKTLPLNDQARVHLLSMADGDGRYLMNMIEELQGLPPDPLLEITDMAALLHRRAPLYDKSQDGHYNLISALHKSVRGSDPDAALYWLARMLDGGEDPRYIIRRVIRMAVEDIGLADPEAIRQCLLARDTYEYLGSPEGELGIAQAVIYLATAPKSNASYVAFKASMRSAKETGSLMPPKHILNAPTKLMQDEGYGEGYAYDHDAPDGFSGQNYFPEGMARASFYDPNPQGFERELRQRLEYWTRLRQSRQE